MGIKQATFEDYDGFVEKFKPKLTTDDCYTPPVAELKKVLLPPDLITAARLRKNCISGVEFAVPFGAAAFVAKCDCGIELFGGGLLLTHEYAEANAAAERAAAERAAAERAELSPREKELQHLLDLQFHRIKGEPTK